MLPSRRRQRVWECVEVLKRCEWLVLESDNGKLMHRMRNEDLGEERCTNRKVVNNAFGDGLMCGACIEQVERNHYKEIRHKVNVILKNNGAESLSQHDFERMWENAVGDFDEEKVGWILDWLKKKGGGGDNEEKERRWLVESGKLSIATRSGENLTLWRCIISNRARASVNEYIRDMVSWIESVAVGKDEKGHFMFRWGIFLAPNGSFAGAIFDRDRIICQKRLSRYTSRRKQGGSQMAAESKKGRIHSAGANLRRYNETKLVEEIREVLTSWGSEIEQCSVLFLSAPGMNSKAFFGKKGVMNRRDPRVQTIPIATRECTMAEAERIHSLLSTVEIEEDLSVDEAAVLVGEKASKMNEMTASIGEKASEASTEPMLERPSSSTASFSSEEERKDRLVDAIKSGDVSLAEKVICEYEESGFPFFRIGESYVYLAVDLGYVDMVECLLNHGESVNSRCLEATAKLRTPLHHACEKGYDRLVRCLLERGADPSLEDVCGLVPYQLCKNEASKTAMRAFAAEYPNRWNYSAARILPKKKSDGSVRNNEKKANLSEKSQSPSETAVSKKKGSKCRAVLCDYCRKRIEDVPFERLKYLYCSSKCVVGHMHKLSLS